LDILAEIRGAYAEITAVFAAIDAVQALADYVHLSNQYSGGQFGPDIFLLTIIFDFFILPLLPSILVGLFLHLIRKFV
jgi:hypothetical protein